MEVLINSDQIIWLLDFSFTRRLHVLLLSFFVIPGWVDVSWRRGKLLNSFLWTEFTTLFVSDRSIVLLRKPNITYLGNDKLWKLHVIPGLLVRGYLGTVASSCSSRRVTLEKKKQVDGQLRIRQLHVKTAQKCDVRCILGLLLCRDSTASED